MSKRDLVIAFLLYFLSGEFVVTLLTMSFSWKVWALFQPVVVLVAAGIVALTVGARGRDER